jgi:hypothetical protein
LAASRRMRNPVAVTAPHAPASKLREDDRVGDLVVRGEKQCLR